MSLLSSISLPAFTEHTVRSLATPASFFKGKQYFYDNAVGVIETEGDRYWARVQGSRPYRVTVYERNGELHAECTCPYNFGGICKHAVATMLKVINEGPKWVKENGFSPTHMVKRMSKPELESFVVDLINQKDGILDLLRVHYLGGNDTASSVADYLKQVEEVFRDERLSIYNTKNVYENLQPIESLAEKLKALGNYREAAKLFEALFEGVAKNLYRIEDSYGLFGEIAGHALDSLVECLLAAGANGTEKYRFVQKFLKSYTRSRDEFFNENYRSAILALADKSTLPEVLTALSRFIEEHACGEECEWPSVLHYEQAVSFKLDVLEKMDHDDEFIGTAYANCDIGAVCLRLAAKLKQNGDAGAAIELVERHIGASSKRDSESLNRFLAASYVEKGETAKAIETYRDLFLATGVFEYYERSRTLAAENGTWHRVFNTIITSASSLRGADALLSEIYLREGMHDEAIRVARISADLTVLEMVAEGIRETHPAESYELYKWLIDIYLDQHMGRAAYQQE